MSAFLDRALPLVFGAALLCSAALPSSGQVELSALELRKAAVIAIANGKPAQARRFAEALIARDAEDGHAQLILARAARDLGDIPTARAAARKGWSLAETEQEKYSAALITAQVLASDNKRTRAQLWLRRAVELAPTDAMRARAKRDFGYVKLRNPWQTDLTFTFAPNSNINNGSANDRSRLNYAVSEQLFGEPIEFTLSAEAQAIAGFEFGGSVRTRYRFHQTAKTAHDAKISLSYRTFVITDDLGEADISGSDFAFGTLAAGYGFRHINVDRRGEISFDTEAGQTWYGGNRYASYLRTQAQQSLIMEGNRRLRFGGDLERQWGQATPDVDTVGLSASITQAFDSGNSGFLGLYTKTTQSPDPNVEYNEITLRTGLALSKPVMGAALQFGVGFSYRDYAVSRDSRDGRQDKRIFADVTATFKEIDYYGFNPTVTFSASSTGSNIGLYDVNRVGLNIGIRSAF